MSFNQILFLDIETAAQHRSYDDLTADWKGCWDEKSKTILKDREGETAATVYGDAALHAEFGRIICICCGVITEDGGTRKLTVKSYADRDEKKLLTVFADMLRNKWNTPGKLLCAYNGKEFDFSFICRRLVINGMSVPPILQIQGKKPWEIAHIDLHELWKFGSRNATKLSLLAQALGLPSPKDDIDGSQVNRVFLNEVNGLERITTYCQKDVVTLAQAFLRFNGEALIPEANIEIKGHPTQQPVQEVNVMVS